MPAALALLPLASAGQEPHGRKPAPYALLFGTMWGPDQRPLPGVEIHIRRATEKKARWTLVSDHHGEFAQRVPPGTMDYVVWADIREKHHPPRHVEAKVHVENDERVDFGLHLTE
ncbi:MAG: hypothetical protein ACREIC_10015 [Limisphaerales bacterium]